MIGQLLIYTRLENFDYRLIYAPSSSFLPEPQRTTFIDFVREVINEDNSLNGVIHEPRWSVIRDGNLTLIGVGCRNNFLKKLYSSKEGRYIRGFYGVVLKDVNDSVIKSLTSIETYRDWFCKFIEPLWNLPKKSEDKVNSNIQEIDIAEENFDGPQITLNTNSSCCTLISCQTNIAELFYSATKYNSVDIVTNLNTSKHVTMSQLYSFRNITILGNNQSDTFKVEKKQHDSRHDARFEDKDDELTYKDKEAREELSVKDCRNYDKLAQWIIKKAKKCGIDIDKLIKSLITNHSGKTETSTTSISEDVDFRVSNQRRKEPIPVASEADIQRDLKEFDNDKKNRRSKLADIKSKFKKSLDNDLELNTTSVEDIGEITEVPTSTTKNNSNKSIELHEL